MKKIIALCLVVVLCVSLAACGEKKDSGVTELSGEYASQDGSCRCVFESDGVLTWYFEGITCEGTYEKTDEGWSVLLQIATDISAECTITEAEDGSIVFDYVGELIPLYKK